MRFAGEADATQLTFYVQALLADARKKGIAAPGPASFRRPAVAPTGPLAFPGKVLALSDSGLAVADTGHHRLLLLDARGALRRVVGSGLEGFSDGPAETASFRRPQGMAEREGQLYVADTENHAIRRVDLATGKVETIAGNGRKGEHVDPSPDARAVALRSPWDVTFVGDALWVAMAGSHQLWQLDVRSGALTPGPVAARKGSSTDRWPARSSPSRRDWPPTGRSSTSPTARPAPSGRSTSPPARCGPSSGRDCSSSATATAR